MKLFNLIGGFMSKSKAYDERYLIFGHVVLFVLFLSILPNETLVGLERIAAAYIVALLVSYGITLNWNKSATVALIFVLIIGLFDRRGPYYDWKDMFNKESRHERFDNLKEAEKAGLKPAGNGTGPTDIKPGDTREMDNTGIKEDDLDTILAADNKAESEGDHKQKEAFNEAGGGLEGLSALLGQARESSPYKDGKGTDDFTPAQAQRQTHRLIDTVEQLKVTMKEMMPLMKSGNNLIQLYQKMGGKEITKAFQ
jgi:hypothetical protein